MGQRKNAVASRGAIFLRKKTAEKEKVTKSSSWFLLR